jgi:transposase-like protein
MVEQDHRAIKRRAHASQGFRSFRSAARTLQGIKTMNMIRKGQVRWVPKGDIAGQIVFVAGLFGLATAA